MRLFTKFLLGIMLVSYPVYVYSTRSNALTDLQCMTANLFFEARSEGYEGMKAVASVTLNRAKSKRYPPTVCAVVFQRKQFSWTHQKSWGAINKIMLGNTKHLKGADLQAYNLAEYVAKGSIRGTLIHPKLQDSMFYHATYVSPKWARNMKKVAKIGVHIFYKG